MALREPLVEAVEGDHGFVRFVEHLICYPIELQMVRFDVPGEGAVLADTIEYFAAFSLFPTNFPTVTHRQRRSVFSEFHFRRVELYVDPVGVTVV